MSEDGATIRDRGPDVPTGEPQHRRRNPWLRTGRSQVLAAVLLGLLGFSLVVQARQTQESGYETLTQSELVRVLDGINERSDRLDTEARDLERTQRELQSGSDRAAAAERAARTRLEVLGILAGTAPATGPGVTLEITDPDAKVGAAILLDTVQELRDAGAEAIQLGPVRVVAGTAFVDAGAGRITAGGRTLSPPYRFVVIGDGATMDSALRIPGGVVETVHRAGATANVRPSGQVTVSATVEPGSAATTPRYAEPAP
jgi:uncharacterized protein YlxW (UPF0749 family)